MANVRGDTVATMTELLINERIMGGCNHPDFIIEADMQGGHRFEYAACTHCDTKAHLYRDVVNISDPALELRKLIPRHCLDMIAINKVLRHLEQNGWRWTVQRRNGSHQFTLENITERIEGPSHKDEAKAAEGALALLANTESRR
ncbi:putative RNA binding protein YcfA (HicA-like mRNA interferase family) [Luteibacter sp. 621]